MTLIDLLAEPIARFILIPMMTCFIETLIIYCSMNDNGRKFSWNLCKWGTSLLTTNFLLIITDIGTKAQYQQVDKEYLSNVIIALFVTTIIAIISSLMVRSCAPVRNHNGHIDMPVFLIHFLNILGSLGLMVSYFIIY